MDQLIQQEGVESMTLAELQQACIARGIRFGNSKSKAFLQERLSEWLELSLDYVMTLLTFKNVFCVLSKLLNNLSHCVQPHRICLEVC